MAFGKKKKKDDVTPEEVNLEDQNTETLETEVVEPEVEEIIDLSDDEIKELIKKAEEGEEFKNKYLYLAAEFDNYRKRMARERKDHMDYAGQNILFDMLSIMDNFSLALKADETETNPKVIIDGIEMIHTQVEKLLEKHNVKPIAAKGEMFNPEIHEALQQIPVPGMKAGEIIEELQKGYKLKDRLLRAARVVVAKEIIAEPEATEEDAAPAE